MADAIEPDYGPYRPLAAQHAAWTRLVDHAGARRVRIGTSVRGQPLEALELGPPEAEATVALLAGLHPIEWIGVEVGLAVLQAWAQAPAPDLRLVAFPLINVDGYREVEHNLVEGTRRYVRTNAQGVDLNRNWPANFRARGSARSGPRPMSSPEVEAVGGHLDAAARVAPIVRALSLHSIGRRILYPYGGRWRGPDDGGAHRRAAVAVRDALAQRYKVSQTSHWVPGAFARGMEIDTLWDRYGAVALLVECSWGGASARRPATLLEPFRWYNPRRPEVEIADLAGAVGRFLAGAL